MITFFSFKKILVVPLSFFAFMQCGFAAHITIDAPNAATSNGQPVIVQVSLDPEQDVISGIGGDFSFPSELFSLGIITSEGGVPVLWVKSPSVSDEKYLDGRTHITFEGIFPGGYDGVRSPFYEGKRKGNLFIATLIPKNKGRGLLMVDSVNVNRFDNEATPLPVSSVARSIVVPSLTGVVLESPSSPLRVRGTTIEAFVTKDPLVANNAWYLVVNEVSGASPVARLFVAETDDYNGELVSDNMWHTARSPYVLFYQDRSKHVHVKALYADNTYTTVTIPPVDNSQSVSIISRILISVALMLFLLYAYVRSHSPQKKSS